MEREIKVTAPEGCEIEKVELIDGVAVVTLKTTYNFKEGDIVFTSSTSSSEIFIFKEISDDGFVQCFCSYDSKDKFINVEKHCIGTIDDFYRFATPEEVLKLLKLIDEEGYVWDAENLELRKKDRKLPKTWEEFCEMSPIKEGECYVNAGSEAIEYTEANRRSVKTDRNILPDRSTAEAIRALMQLIQLRDCYNGDWVPDWKDSGQNKYQISFEQNKFEKTTYYLIGNILYFKTKELRDEFLLNFRNLIEKLKPIYGIKTDNQQ